MFTDKRLTQAYKNAKVQYFDKDSKYILFSDFHRGDDSVSDEFTKNQVLMTHILDNYYNKGYSYIEVGDGDELWEYSKFEYIRMAHGDIFTTLKKFYDDNRMILLYGNHNIHLKYKQYIKKNYYYYYDEYRQNSFPLFPDLKAYEALILKEKTTKQELFILHGHQGDLMNDQLWYLNMLFLRYFWRYLHVVGFRNPASPARNLFKRHKVERNYRRWIHKHKKILICGHTHRPRFPLYNELPYFNTGCCIHTKSITGIEIKKGKIAMVDWRMKAMNDGTIKIVRTVIKDPVSISKYKKFCNYKQEGEC